MVSCAGSVTLQLSVVQPLPSLRRKEVSRPMADEETRLPPPSTAWPRFIARIDRMREEGVPEKIDKLYLADMAEGTQYNYRQTFRSLGLTGDDDRSLPLLRELAGADPDQRPGLFGKIMSDRYPDLTGLPPDATNDDLFVVLRDHYGVTSDAQVKKIRAFLSRAIDYAGMSMSPHIRPAKPGPGSRNRSERWHVGQPASRPTKTTTHIPASPADERKADRGGYERQDISLGDAGRVSVVVDITRWWDLSDDQFAKLRNLMKAIEALEDSGS